MAFISVVLQDEDGNQIGERVDLPARIIPNVDDTRFICLRFIDPYGNTVFNRLQMPVLLAELHHLRECEEDDVPQDLIRSVEALGNVCRQEPHLYVKFIGD